MKDTTPIHETFYKARKKADLSQAEVSRRLREYGMKVSPSTVTKWEAGERSISMDAAMRLCDVLGVQWEDLYLPPQADDVDPLFLEVQTLANQLDVSTGQLGLVGSLMSDWADRLTEVSDPEDSQVPADVLDDFIYLAGLMGDIVNHVKLADDAAITCHGLVSRILKRLNGSA